MLDWTTILPYSVLLSGLALLLAGLSLSDYRASAAQGARAWRGDGRIGLLGALLVGGGLALAPAPPLWRALGLAVALGAPAAAYARRHTGARARVAALAGRVSRTEPLWLALLWPVALFPTPPLTPLLLALPALWAARRVARGRFVPRTPFDWPLALLLLMVLVSAFVTPDLAYSLPKITGALFGVAVFYALVEWGRTEGRIRAAFAGYAGAGAALALLGLLGTEWLIKFPGVGAAAERLPQGVRGLPGAENGFQPNEVAGSLLLVALPLVALNARLWRERGAPAARIAAGLGLALTCGALLLTQSRGALLGAAAGGLALAALGAPRARPIIAAGLAALLAVVIAIGPGPILGAALDASPSSLSAVVSPVNLAVREEVWRSAAQAIGDHPLTGLGMNMFRRALRTTYPAPSVPAGYDIAHAHNQLAQTALDLGLPGLVAYLALWLLAAGMLGQAWRRAADAPSRTLIGGVAAGLLAFFVFGITDAIALGAKPGALFWAALALVAAQWRLAEAPAAVAPAREADPAWAGVGGRATARGLLREAATPGRLAVVVIAIGAGLRLYRLNALSLSLDEGLLAQAARQPWARLLDPRASGGAPPLYTALVKMAALVAPEAQAGRLVSALAGMATVAALYALAARLLGPWRALPAAGIIAVAPMAIWYAQEARAPALTTLLVAVSYLALVRGRQRRRASDVWTYGAASGLALYSGGAVAAIALAPQLAALVWLGLRGKPAGRALGLGAAAAALAFLPWAAAASGAGSAGAATPDGPAGWNALLAVAGVVRQDAAFGLYAPALWDRAPWLAGAIGVALLGAALAGAMALTRRAASGRLLLGTALAAALLAGTGALPGAAPAEALLPATLGLALGLAGLPALRRPRIAPAGAAALVALGVAGISLGTLWGAADKQHWRDLAAASRDVARFGLPVFSYPAVAGALSQMYHGAGADPQGIISDGAGLPAGARGPALWLAYMEAPGIERVRDDLAARGYRRVGRQAFWHSLYLDLYAAPGAALGAAIPLNGAFAGGEGAAPGWTLPPGAFTLAPTAGGGRALTLRGGQGETRAAAVVPGGAGLYALDLQAQAPPGAGPARAFLICAAADGRWSVVAPDGQGATVPDDGVWAALRIGAVCPAGTAHVIVDLRNAGGGAVSYRAVSLQVTAPADGAK
jgi:putative inorganic carbon (hco3(-)) transporter